MMMVGDVESGNVERTERKRGLGYSNRTEQRATLLKVKVE